MSKRVSYIFEIIVATVIYWIGLSNINVLFISGPRTAAITLGIIGLLFYITNTMGYVLRNPLHPIAMLGSVFAMIAKAVVAMFMPLANIY